MTPAHRASAAREERARAILAAAAAVGAVAVGSALALSAAEALLGALGVRASSLLVAAYAQPLVLTVVACAFRARAGWRFRRELPRSLVARATIAWALVVSFETAYARVAASLGFELPAPQSQLAREAASGAWATALVVFGVAVLAPVAEELFFRGTVFAVLRRGFGFGGAAFATSAVFGLLHGAALALPVFVLSMALCYCYETSGSLDVPVLIHVVNNLASIALAMRAG